MLYALLQREDAKSYDISALTRQEEKLRAFEDLGLRAVGGSLDDLDVIRRECSQADIVLSLAHADHDESVKAMLQGMAEYKRRTGKPSIFIHTVRVQTLGSRFPARDVPWTLTGDADPGGHFHDRAVLASLPSTARVEHPSQKIRSTTTAMQTKLRQ